MSTEILTLVLTGVVVWIAFKYINRDEESSWKEKVLVWLKNLIARPGGVVIPTHWFKGPSSKERAKVPDPESLKPDEQPRTTAKSSERADLATLLPSTPPVSDEFDFS